MKTFSGYSFLKPEDQFWRLSNLMKIPNTDLLEHTKSENIGARLWRYPPGSAGTWHRHVKAEEYYFVLEGTGRIRIGEDTLTIPKYSGVLVGPEMLRQVFNDTDSDVLWFMVGAPEQEFEPGEPFDLKRFYPEEPTQLPKELAGKVWPPKQEG